MFCNPIPLGKGIILFWLDISKGLTGFFDTPWVQYIPTVAMFVAGLWLGYLLFRPETDIEDNEDQIDTDTLEDQKSDQKENSQANLEGELQSTQSLVEAQQKEIGRRDEKLALLQRQLQEKQDRIGRIAALTSTSRNASPESTNTKFAAFTSTPKVLKFLRETFFSIIKHQILPHNEPTGLVRQPNPITS